MTFVSFSFLNLRKNQNPMRSFIQTSSLICSLLVFVACATKAVGAVNKVDHGVTKEIALANFSSDQLQQGQNLFESSCTQCHKLFEPNSRDASKWNNVLDRMLPKTSLSAEEGKLVQAYLLVNSK